MVTVEYLYDANNVMYGFKILVDEKPVFIQDKAPSDVATWDTTTITNMAEEIKNRYIDSIYRNQKIRRINEDAKQFIVDTLRVYDWGKTYEECLSELSNSAQVYETRAYYILNKYDSNSSITTVREYVAQLLTGSTDIDTLITTLSTTVTDTTDLDNLRKYFTLGYEVAKIMNWIEDVWVVVEDAENYIKTLTNPDDIGSYGVTFPELQ